MGKIKCEWLDKQPTFKKKVKLKDGTVIGTIHALTKFDYSEIFTKSDGFTNQVEFSMWSIIQSLTGHGCGWELDRELNYENLNVLSKDFFNAFAEAVNNFEKQNEITEEIVKN
jgi:hypothetical protein